MTRRRVYNPQGRRGYCSKMWTGSRLKKKSSGGGSPVGGLTCGRVPVSFAVDAAFFTTRTAASFFFFFPWETMKTKVEYVVFRIGAIHDSAPPGLPAASTTAAGCRIRRIPYIIYTWARQTFAREQRGRHRHKLPSSVPSDLFVSLRPRILYHVAKDRHKQCPTHYLRTTSTKRTLGRPPQACFISFHARFGFGKPAQPPCRPTCGQLKQ